MVVVSRWSLSQIWLYIQMLSFIIFSYQEVIRFKTLLCLVYVQTYSYACLLSVILFL